MNILPLPRLDWKFDDWKNRICRGECDTYWFGGINKFPQGDFLRGSHMRRVILQMNVGWPVQSMLYQKLGRL